MSVFRDGDYRNATTAEAVTMIDVINGFAELLAAEPKLADVWNGGRPKVRVVNIRQPTSTTFVFKAPLELARAARVRPVPVPDDEGSTNCDN